MDRITEFCKKVLIFFGIVTALIPILCQFHPATKDQAIAFLHSYASLVDKIEVGR